jgi:hypothetical protein
LRGRLGEFYEKWKIEKRELPNLTDKEQEIINNQEKVWRLLGFTDEVADVVGKYSLANIRKEEVLKICYLIC